MSGWLYASHMRQKLKILKTSWHASSTTIILKAVYVGWLGIIHTVHLVY